MKKAVSAIIVVVLLAGLLLTGCRMEGSGNIETREFDFSDFTKVEIGSAFNFEISRSDSYGISITMDDNMFENIQVTKEGETLKIGIPSRIALITIEDFGTTVRKAVIRMPQLTGLDISGASEGIISGFESTEELEMDVSGASELSFRNLVAGNIDIGVSGASIVLMTGSVRDIVAEASGASRIELVTLSAGDVELSLSGSSRIVGNLNADNIDFYLSGASSALMHGSAGDIKVQASGASRVDLANLTVNNAGFTLTGASTASINLDGKLDIFLSRASSLNYTGTPIMGECNISGGSTINNINK